MTDGSTGFLGRIGKISWSSPITRLQRMFGSTNGIVQVAEKQETDQRSVTDKEARVAQERPVNLATMMAGEDSGSSSGGKSYQGTGLRDLPESSIAYILSLTTPRDVARLACVSKCFRDASESDVVWQMMLPSSYADILAQTPNAPASTSSKKDVYNFLCNPVLLRSGTRDFWLDRATGKACQSIGAREMRVVWGEDEHYWEWCSDVEGSRFPEVAYLKYVWWLEVNGKWQCTLSPGTYTFYWRLCLRPRDHQRYILNRDDYSIGPVTFQFEASGNEPVDTVCYLSGQCAMTRGRLGREGVSGGRQPLGYRWDRGMRWMELDVGEFTVENENLPFEIDFRLKDVDCNRTKSYLHIDGVGIRPSCTIENRIVISDPAITSSITSHSRSHPKQLRRRLSLFGD